MLPIMIAAAYFRVVSNDHGVEVSQRLDTHILEFKAQGAIPAPPERVQAELLEFERKESLAKEVAESRVINRSATSLDVYQRLKLPVVSDRDYTLHVTWGKSEEVPGALFIKLITDNTKGPPPRDGVQRIDTHEGEWLLAPSADGKSTTASYHLRLDMGGSVKPWMAKSGAADGITDLFDRLRSGLKTTEASNGQGVRDLDVRRR